MSYEIESETMGNEDERERERERESLGFEFVEKEARASKYIRVIL